MTKEAGMVEEKRVRLTNEYGTIKDVTEKGSQCQRLRIVGKDHTYFVTFDNYFKETVVNLFVIRHSTALSMSASSDHYFEVGYILGMNNFFNKE